MALDKLELPGGEISGLVAKAVEYMVDAGQRSVLFLDIMRQRGDQYRQHVAQTAPHVFSYAAELVIDGRKLDEPVNYALVRIIPPKGVEIDLNRRPFVVVDPRAGHGPGIGGFKADSEIGVAMKAGHPCYFIGFLPEPMPGQTIECIARAGAIFIEKVIERHPNADGKPCVIGNCQAGWAVMILASLRPELFGPLIIAGAPLAYWAGVHGKYPMRYSGGLLGGSWLTALTSDLGAGKFDGAWLVQNFEGQNPANTLWSKQYNVYSKVDSEADRYLEFERWWGGHVNLNAAEIQFIVDELFIGNNLAAGKIKTRDGTSIDLRNIRSPIVIFCSKGDNITPPAQALGWILDLYDDVDEIRSYGQTIVYAVHDTIGHLGIFVSSGVARKEHGELSSNIDLIHTLPPGLYEATFECKTQETAHSDLVVGDWVMRCEQRTLDDIRKLGCNGTFEDLCFATAARISETNLALYRAFLQPVVKALVNPTAAALARRLHPLRLQYELFSDANPVMAGLGSLARWTQEHRRIGNGDNPFLMAQEAVSKQIVATLDAVQEARDTAAEQTFFSIYSSAAVQAAAGFAQTSAAQPTRKAGRSRLHQELLQSRIAELKSQIAVGGVREAIVRSALYIGMAREAVDERAFEMVRRIRRKGDTAHISLSAFKRIVREQYFMLLIDPDASLNAIPAMLPPEHQERAKALDLIRQVVTARGEIVGE